MSCCGKNKGNYYTHACEKDYDDYESGNNFTGISCPYQNNNDCLCEDSLREAAARLTNQRVIIHVDGCKMCVVIVAIGQCFLKTVNPCTQKIVYFNLNRINNIEDVLPRCY